jgi:hypothetical protein
LAHRESVFIIEIFHVYGRIEELTEGNAAGGCKGKSFPCPPHTGTEGEYMYSSTNSLPQP